ncbi:hypothetical protein BHM03_00047641, partial [Ensete ventricosum]
CPNPSFPFCVTATAPTQATTALARWQLPCKGAATPTAGAVAPAGGRAGCGRPAAGPLFGHCAASGCAHGRLSPLRDGRSRPCPWAATAPAGGAFAYKCHPAGCCPYGRLPPLAGAAGLPFALALVITAAPLQGALAVGGRPCMGAGRGSSPLLLATFTAKMQQEHIERFFTI